MIRRFRGESVHKVDPKGRVSVPAPFRRVLEEGDPDWIEGLNPNFVLIYGRPGARCLEGYSMQSIQEVDDTISRLPRFSADRERLERMLNTKSTYAQLDETGRILLSSRLREMIGLAGDALFAGMGEKFQIWKPSDYERDETEGAREAEGREAELFALLDRASAGGGGDR